MANKYEVNQYQSQIELDGSPEKQFGGSVGFDRAAGSLTVTGPRPLITSAGSNAIRNDKVLASPFYADQVPPFNIVITAANEYGHSACMAIYGVEVLNCGSGLSIDDITTDEACTFVATAIKPWSDQASFNLRTAEASSQRHSDFRAGAQGGAV